MLQTLGRALLPFIALTLGVVAAAQHPMAGVWQETEIGFVVTFEQQPNGQLTGVLQGQDLPMPLSIVSDERNVQGTFSLQGQTLGFAAQLQADDTTLLIWLYEVDAAGQPVQNSYEQYVAYRAQASAAPPFAAQPQAPAGAPFGGAATPVQPGGAQAGNPFGGAATPVQPGAPTGAPFGGAAAPVQPGGGQAGVPFGAAPQSASSAASVVGVWQSDAAFDDGTPFSIRLTFQSGGAWTMEIVIQGGTVASYGGTYALSQDGLLQYQETNRSPQICFQGECQPNTSDDASGADYVQFPPDGSLVMTDAATGEQVSYRRVGVP